MKKHSLTLIISMLFISTFSIAQKARIGFTAGATLANVAMDAGDVKISTDSKLGFTAGLMVDKPMGNHFIFQPALNFVQKGTKQDDVKVNLNYLEVPLNFLYRSNSRDGFFAGAGPSLAFGLGGKSKDDTGSEKIKFGSGDDADLKTMDFGANIVAGYHTKSGFTMALNYNIGLTNLEANSDYIKTRNNYWGLRIGYILK